MQLTLLQPPPHQHYFPCPLSCTVFGIGEKQCLSFYSYLGLNRKHTCRFINLHNNNLLYRVTRLLTFLIHRRKELTNLHIRNLFWKIRWPVQHFEPPPDPSALRSNYVGWGGEYTVFLPLQPAPAVTGSVFLLRFRLFLVQEYRIRPSLSFRNVVCTRTYKYDRQICNGLPYFLLYKVQKVYNCTQLWV